VIPDAPRKSLGSEETFERDLVDPGEIGHALLSLSDRVASRLRGQGISGRTVTLKVRYSNFTTVTRSRTLKQETDGALDVFRVAMSLLPPEVGEGRKRVRLLGVSLSNLSEWPALEQLSFEPQPRWSHAEKAIDGIRRRFGDESLRYGGLLERLYPPGVSRMLNGLIILK
jgi:DNA polymerase-4